MRSKVQFKTAFKSHCKWSRSLELGNYFSMAYSGNTVAYRMSFVSTARARVPKRNAAREKPTIQSSTYSAASKAVDGEIEPGPAACTYSDLHSWWAVDLFERLLIQEVNIITDKNVAFGTYYNIFTDETLRYAVTLTFDLLILNVCSLSFVTSSFPSVFFLVILCLCSVTFYC